MTNGVGETPASFRVRPYLLTGGRTRSEVDLPLEALVRTTDSGLSAIARLADESLRIVTLCTNPQSIAEISAHLAIPLQVTRVLVGDLVGMSLITTSQSSSSESSERPDVKLLERVLDGLQSL